MIYIADIYIADIYHAIPAFDQRVINIVKNCNYLQVLRHLLASVTEEVAKMMACSIIGCRIDYCNSLFYGTTDRNLKF